MSEEIQKIVRVNKKLRLHLGPTLSEGGVYIVEGHINHTHYEMTHIGSDCYRWEAFTKIGAREFFNLLDKGDLSEGQIVFPDGGTREQTSA